MATPPRFDVVIAVVLTLVTQAELLLVDGVEGSFAVHMPSPRRKRVASGSWKRNGPRTKPLGSGTARHVTRRSAATTAASSRPDEVSG
jgi:hypothetical protein